MIISSDLPLQGASASTSESTNNMIELYLEQIGNKVGDYTIKFQSYDDSTAAKGAWDDAACAKNATDHVANDGRGRRDGHVQLRLRQDPGADAQPGQHRPDADGVAREHQPGPDQGVGDR